MVIARAVPRKTEIERAPRRPPHLPELPSHRRTQVHCLARQLKDPRSGDVRVITVEAGDPATAAVDQPPITCTPRSREQLYTLERQGNEPWCAGCVLAEAGHLPHGRLLTDQEERALWTRLPGTPS